MTTAVAEDRLTTLEAKLDAVSHQLDYVAAALREQEVRRGMWDELRHDLAPVTAEAMERVTQELDEVRGFIEPDAMLRLLKRLLRDLPYFEALLDQVESLSSLGADVAPLGRAMRPDRHVPPGRPGAARLLRLRPGRGAPGRRRRRRAWARTT